MAPRRSLGADMKRVILAAAMAALASQFGGTGVVDARQVDDLKFRKNYFVTGDYVVAGIGLRGRGVGGVATADINVTGRAAGRGYRVGSPLLAGGG